VSDPRFNSLDKTLKRIFNEVDEALEDQYGGDFTLHPARTPRGGTANPSSNGLFNVGASFSAGYGSELGRGYVVEIHMSTLENVPSAVRDEIEQKVMEMLRDKLDETMPDKELFVEKDGSVVKIHGDLSPL